MEDECMKLDEVLTFSEAAEKWGLADGKTIRKAVERQRFLPHEIKKSGNVWLTTYAAMQRVFGEPKADMVVLYYRDIIANENIAEILEDYFEKAAIAIEKGEMVSVVESKENPDKILYILKTKEELEHEKHRLQYFFTLKGYTF